MFFTINYNLKNNHFSMNRVFYPANHTNPCPQFHTLFLFSSRVEVVVFNHPFCLIIITLFAIWPDVFLLNPINILVSKLLSFWPFNTCSSIKGSCGCKTPLNNLTCILPWEKQISIKTQKLSNLFTQTVIKSYAFTSTLSNSNKELMEKLFHRLAAPYRKFSFFEIQSNRSFNAQGLQKT